MAWKFSSSPSLPTPSPATLKPIEKLPLKIHGVVIAKPLSNERHLICNSKASQTEGMQEEPLILTGSSARTQLSLLEQLRTSTSSESVYEENGNIANPTVREQLSEIIGGRYGDFTIPLGKKLKASVKTLTVSQRRNIKRQAYLNEVGRRNDSVFFATIGAFIIVPPVAILVIAILTGYVQLFP